MRRLVSSDQGTSTSAAEDHVATRTMLVQSDLPKLRAAGLVDWSHDQGVVDTAEHPAFGDPRFLKLLHGEFDALNDVLLALSHDYRRIVLSVLWAERDRAKRDELARTIVTCLRREGTLGSVTDEQIGVALHHSHLPKLSQWSFVEYDPSSGTVRYASHATLEDVLSMLYAPPEQIDSRYHGFLSGLLDTYREATRDRSDYANWPHNWGDPHHG